MKKLITTLLTATLLFANTAYAGALEDANKAYDSGNYAKAMKLYKSPALKGLVDAQYNLGVMYANGQGVVQDYVAAHMWFNLAAAQGDKDAVKSRGIEEQKMTAQQIAEAQKLARECLARNYKGC